jgi:hypothetical protein
MEILLAQAKARNRIGGSIMKRLLLIVSIILNAVLMRSWIRKRKALDDALWLGSLKDAIRDKCGRGR